jgi:hypothetical protein
MLMGALESRVVVELGIPGEADRLPIRQQGGHGDGRSKDAAGPRPNQAAVQRHAVQDFNMRPLLNHQAFNKIEAVEFGAATRHVGQIPAWRRRGAAHTPLSIQHAPPGEDPMDRPHGGHVRLPAAQQRATQRDGAILPEITGRAQFLPKIYNPLFYLGRGPLLYLPRVRPIAPVNAIQTLRARSMQRTLHRRQTDVIDARDGSHGLSQTNVANHRFAPPRRRCF